MKRVCIIGASGKLGQYMVGHALERGYEVVGVCRERSVGKLEPFRGRITIIPGFTNDRSDLAVISHGFERMRLNRIEALVYVENGRSIQLLQRLGFKQEGVLRDYLYLAGKFYDHYFLPCYRRSGNHVRGVNPKSLAD